MEKPRTSTHPTGRLRRTTAQVRQLLLEAATTLFESGDYGSTSTRSIAQAAGVSESVLFRHFGSKGNLLAAAVVAPFSDFLAEFRQTWQDQHAGPSVDEEATLKDLVTILYDNLRARRGLVRSLVGASRSPDTAEAVVAVHEQLETIFCELELIGRESAELRGASSAALAIQLRAVVAMVFGLAVLDDWFMPTPRLDRQRLIDDLTELTLNGARGR